MDTVNDNSKNEPWADGGDYLWNGSGEPDPEIQSLEALLGKFRHTRPAPILPQMVRKKGWAVVHSRLRLAVFVATAAAVATIAGVIFLVPRTTPLPVDVAGWEISRVAGSPRIGRNGLTKESDHLGVGQVLETDSQSRARLEATNVGQIEIEPSTRLRLLTMGKTLQQVALDRGTIHAYIWAPPGQFVVHTPSAVIVDLGCAYTLHVDDAGAGLVRASLGWVGFKMNGHESFIPAGAACATRPQVGPGTPHFEDAPSELQAALSKLDFDDMTPQQRAKDLATVLAYSRPRDALTLWHLLTRVDPDQRARVFDRLKELAPPPANVTKQGILRLDQAMLDLWWNMLGFDDISVWRRWEHAWSGAATTNREE